MDLLQSRMHHRLLTNQIEISLQENSALTNGDLAYLQQQITLWHGHLWAADIFLKSSSLLIKH